jgi:hypothetical protein
VRTFTHVKAHGGLRFANSHEHVASVEPMESM